MTRQLEIPENTIKKYFDQKNKLNPKDYLITDLLHSLFSEDSNIDPSKNYYIIYGLNSKNKLVLYAIDERDISNNTGDVNRLEILKTKKGHEEYAFYLLQNENIPNNIRKEELKDIKIHQSNVHLLRSSNKIKQLEKMYKTSIENGDYLYEGEGPFQSNLIVPICSIEAQDTNSDMRLTDQKFYGIPIDKNTNNKVEFNFILKEYITE